MFYPICCQQEYTAAEATNKDTAKASAVTIPLFNLNRQVPTSNNVVVLAVMCGLPRTSKTNPPNADPKTSGRVDPRQALYVETIRSFFF